MKRLAVILALGFLCVPSSKAVDLTLSIGIRETGGTGPAFSNAGSAGGIEWVNLDGQALTLDGSWQYFSFTPSTDTLTAFAGATADGVLDVDWASLEHIRILNSDGITAPIQLWIDDVSNADNGGTATEGFESFTAGDEVMFRAPDFSGSTSGNVLAGGTSAVTDSTAYSGGLSYEVDFQFVDDSTTRWVRLTSFNAPNIPNAAMHVNELDGAPTISFYAKAAVVPEPATLALAVVGGLGLMSGLIRRRR